jgi:hypothetical protein
MYELARIRPDRPNGFSNGGWCYDRYPDLEPLNAGATITVADIEGPGVIRHIHVTRHGVVPRLGARDLLARGIVLEVWYDDARLPAVCCPLADFFADGCNGHGALFSNSLIECAPGSYNSYLPIPFNDRVQVRLRNDTDQDTLNYSYVEWEPLPKWDTSLGFLHATYRRQCLQVNRDSDESFFRVEGSGHVIGRQFSIVTDEPLFNNFMYIMEGNNEIDIDDRERAIDYLGTEDSFTFSWGFDQVFSGARAGMTLIDRGVPHRLSMYRFHDHLPVRFDQSLHWHINWRHERLFVDRPEWAEAVGRGGCWADFATVFYWYQSQAGGYAHDELPKVSDRMESLLQSSLAPFHASGPPGG